MFKKIILLFSLFFSFKVNAQDLAVLLYVDKEEGNRIYETYTKEFGFKRKLKQGVNKDFEFHVTLGYINNVEPLDVPGLKDYILKNLESKTKNIIFEVGAIGLLGKGKPYIVALPRNVEIFLELNKELEQILLNYQSGKYTLAKISQNKNYIPHISLNAKIHDQVKLNKLPDIIHDLDKKMSNSKINLTKLVVN